MGPTEKEGEEKEGEEREIKGLARRELKENMA